MFSEQFFEFRKIDIKGIWPERAFFPELIDILDQSDLAELALIIESESVIFYKNEQHPRVARRLVFAFKVTQRAGHAEVQTQPDVAVRAHKKMLAMTGTAFEPSSFQLPSKLTSRNAFQQISA